MPETTEMEPQKVDPHLTARIVRSYVQHHTVGTGQVSDSLHRYIERLVSLDGSLSPRKFSLPLCRCGNLYARTMWSASIAATEPRCCVGISVRGIG
jgi:hypothetical protein